MQNNSDFSGKLIRSRGEKGGMRGWYIRQRKNFVPKKVGGVEQNKKFGEPFPFPEPYFAGAGEEKKQNIDCVIQKRTYPEWRIY